MSVKNQFPHAWENMQKMQRKISVKLEREQSDLPKRIRKTAARSGTLDGLAVLYEYVDRYFSNAKNLVACKQGCANCCHGRVWISQAEADFIADRNNRQAPIIETIEDKETFAIRDASRPCPFLDKDLSCTIYSSRPLVCRTHLNFEPTNDLCKFENAHLPLPLVDRDKTIPGVMAAFVEIHDKHGGGGGDIRRYFITSIR
jgi:Fe-S-cluster containining protein